MNAICTNCKTSFETTPGQAQGPCPGCGHVEPWWYIPGPDNQPQRMTHAELVAALASGQLPQTTYVFHDGAAGWLAASAVAALKPVAKSAARPAPAAKAAPAQPAAAPAQAQAAAPKGRARGEVSWTLWSEGGIDLEQAAELQKTAAAAAGMPAPAQVAPTAPPAGKWTRAIVVVLLVAAVAAGIALAVVMRGKKSHELLPPAPGGAEAPAAPAAP